MLNKLKQAASRGNVCIIGPPGSGKTSILIELLTWLTRDERVSAQRILVFCFNRKWAKIIREQNALAAAGSCLEMPVNTFHSFCLDFLSDLEIYFFTKGKSCGQQRLDGGIEILNSTQQWSFLVEIMNGLDKKDYPISKRYLLANPYTANSYIQEVFDFILRAQENLLEPRILLDEFNPYFSKALSEIAGIYSRYKRKLRQLDAYNYGLLLQDTVRLLKQNSNIREMYSNKFDYVIVDEFQELNKAQLEIVDLISKGNCIFFGNDDESIYSFRGSMSENFDLVCKRTGIKNIIKLKHNFRSSKNINKLASKFIAGNQFRMDKKSTSSFSRGEVMVKDFYNMLEEAGFICSKIKQLSHKGLPLGSMAIIIKGLGYETHILENALKHSGIPFHRSGSRTVLDNNIVRYMLSLLRLFRKPFGEIGHIDSLVESIMLSSVMEIDPLYLKKIFEQYHSCTSYANLLEFLKDWVKKAGEDAQIYRIKDFLKAIERFEKIRGEDAFDFLLQLVKDPRLGLAAKKDMDWNGVSDFLSSVKNFTQASNHTSIDSYLDFLDEVAQSSFLEEIEKSTLDNRTDKVSLLSFHQCKGMEFEAVFIPFINLEYLPATFHFPQSYDMQLFAYLDQGQKYSEEELKQRHLEDERRLLYVGMTRARNYVYVTSNRVRQYSTFFLELKKIYRKMGLKKQREKNPLPDSSNCWEARRRALALSSKHIRGLNYSKYKLNKYISFLNNHYPPHKWWINTPFTANKNNPFRIFKDSFSYSELDTYRQCPLKYKYSCYLNVRIPYSLSLKLGILYHKVIYLFFRQGRYGWEDLKNTVEKLFEEEDFSFRALKAEYKNKALSDFKNFYQNLLPPNPESSISEQDFTFNLGPHTIKGRIDQINFISEDEIEIIDYKSGSRNFSSKDLKEEIQLKLYRMAVQRSDSLRYLNNKRIRLKYITLGSSKPVAELTSAHYEEEELKKIVAGIIKKAKGENFSPSEGYFTCQSCDFKKLCERFYG